MKKVILSLIFLLGFSLMSCKKQAESEAKPEAPKNLYIFFTDDLLGEIDLCGCPGRPMGGVARRAKYVQRLVELGEAVIQLDAGDSFFRFHPSGFPIPESEKEFARVIAKSSAKMKLDAFNVGVLDMSLGTDFLKELKKQAKPYGDLSLISSNLYDRAMLRPIFETEKVIERAGIRVGVFGLTRETAEIPANILVREPKATSEQMVKRLREEKGCDLVIGLFNLGLEESKKLVEQVPGINLVIVSGNPQYLWSPELVENTLLVQAGAGGKYLGQLKIILPLKAEKKASKEELADLRERLAQLEAQVALLQGEVLKEPAFAEKYNQLKKEKEKVKKELEQRALKFEYNYFLIPLDADLPVDQEIKVWVVEALTPAKSQ